MPPPPPPRPCRGGRALQRARPAGPARAGPPQPVAGAQPPPCAGEDGLPGGPQARRAGAAPPLPRLLPPPSAPFPHPSSGRTSGAAHELRGVSGGARLPVPGALVSARGKRLSAHRAFPAARLDKDLAPPAPTRLSSLRRRRPHFAAPGMEVATRVSVLCERLKPEALEALLRDRTCSSTEPAVAASRPNCRLPRLVGGIALQACAAAGNSFAAYSPQVRGVEGDGLRSSNVVLLVGSRPRSWTTTVLRGQPSTHPYRDR
eukprot:scaffold1073_cov383-Prasinococcus_capsulatus_cf.AAC.4